MKKRILAIVVLYNPIIEESLVNILKYLNEVETLIVWDNSPGKNVRDKNKICFTQFHNVQYKTLEKNVGISRALNYAVEVLIRDKYDYLLTMDQDSHWENFNEFIDIATTISHKEIGTFSPNINNAFKDSNIYTIDHRTITSGMLIPASTYQQVGKYNEIFFVDGIDVEFGRRVEKANLQNVRINKAVLKQKYGEAKVRIPWGYSAPEYSPFRLYGILYSHIWIWRHYSLPINVIYEILFIYIIRTFFDVIFYQNDKRNKILSICKGIKAGFKD